MSVLGGKACVQRKEVEFEAEYLSKKYIKFLYKIVYVKMVLESKYVVL